MLYQNTLQSNRRSMSLTDNFRTGGPSGIHASNFCFTQGQRDANPDSTLCQYPTGVFVLAIIST